MADEQLEAPKDEKKKGGKLKWIIIAVVILALLGGGAFMFKDKIMGMLGMGGDKAAEQAQDGQPVDPLAAGDQGDPKDTVLVSLPTFVVNLADPLGRRYLKLTLDVEMRNQDAADKLSQNEPKVRDAVILLLSSKTFADLSTMESKIGLKDEIVKRLNQIVGGSNVLRVYFTELVVQ